MKTIHNFENGNDHLRVEIDALVNLVTSPHVDFVHHRQENLEKFIEKSGILAVVDNCEPRQDGRSSSDQFDLPPFHRPENHRHVFVNKYRYEMISQKHYHVRREGPARVAQRSKDAGVLGLQLWRQGNQAQALT